jgi:PTS system ascorbate-specific IIC component
MIGFVTATIGMIVAMFISGLVWGAVPLVSIIGAFFTGGVAGIMGNALGGRRGAIVSGFCYGFILIFLSGMVYFLFSESLIAMAGYGAGAVGHDCVDAMITMVAFRVPYVGMAILVAAYVLYSIIEVRYKKRVKTEEK